MSRRTIVRPRLAATVTDDRRRQKLQAEVRKAQEAVARWWRRLQRVMNALQKHQRRLARLQKQLTSANP